MDPVPPPPPKKKSNNPLGRPSRVTYAEKLAKNKEWHRNKYANDPEYHAKHQARSKAYYQSVTILKRTTAPRPTVDASTQTENFSL